MFFSPAKTNLYFHVLSKRSDGFHEIASLYQALSFGDLIRIEPISGSDRLTCTNPSVPTDHSNLILRASSLFKEKTGVDQGLAFHLEKKIPMAAGLGGGSSNAATTLWALNEMLQTGVPEETLASWGALLGSDVPFFFSEGRAECRGRGEIVKPLQKEDNHLWIAIPRFSLSTKSVYENVRLEALTNDHVLRNDLEVSAFELSPELFTLKQNLKAIGFEHVQMTGSGTAFYLLGSVSEPKLEGVDVIPAHFLSRKAKHWYKFT